jgi:SAM-dependent methyltransferase
MALENTPCPICAVDDARTLARVRDLNLLTPGRFRLVRCRRCGLVYLNPRPGADEVGAYYTRDYWVPAAGGEDERDLGAGFRRAVSRIVREYPGGKVLDVGCGAGRQASAMQRRGLVVSGVDPYQSACAAAREQHGIEALCTTLQEAPFPDESFDALTFFDVLEHVHDPLGDLRKALALLRPGGTVVVKAPNIEALQARLLGKWWYLEVPRHLTHFSPATLRRALEVAGFAYVWSHAIPGWRFGAALFEMSLLHWLRAVQFARRGVAVTPAEGQSVGEALAGLVYPSVPSVGKRAFRWVLRNLVYLPVGVENWIGRSTELLAFGRRPAAEAAR